MLRTVFNQSFSAHLAVRGPASLVCETLKLMVDAAIILGLFSADFLAIACLLIRNSNYFDYPMVCHPQL